MRQIVSPASMRSSMGFTLIELVVVVGVIIILSALALPSYNQWRQNLAYRDAARNVMSELRQAKSQAIASNVTQCVRFDAVNKQYGFNNNDCGTISNWTEFNLASQVTISPTIIDIKFSPTGVVSPSGISTISILDSTGKQRFYVQVEQTGRIFIKGPL